MVGTGCVLTGLLLAVNWAELEGDSHQVTSQILAPATTQPVTSQVSVLTTTHDNGPYKSRYLPKKRYLSNSVIFKQTFMILFFMHSPGCINTLPSCQTLITLIKESVIASRKITLSFQQRCSLTYSNNIVFLHSPGCINILPTCQTLITLITLITESDISSRKITFTLSFQQRYLLTCSYNIVFLYSLGCINILSSRETLITLITLITESVISSRKVTLTLSFRRRNFLTCSHDI